ncbi:response regulator [Cohnella sp. LGH]|uniref:response regulator n=1 Tax=Cohnella sp. LGH TaxID=1619153 RepID=UPI001AD96298|nr:response regulator [Cohnella sp. LGH]QTH46415.1 response regulator [Cohnella sp. LGH]
MFKLLVAEDESALRMLLADTLEDEGYEVDLACDGEEALERIAVGSYDLIVLDNMMPKYTGYEVIEKARQLPDGKHLKILMLTAKSQQAERDRVLLAGANDFMSKPFSPLALVQKIGEMLDA